MIADLSGQATLTPPNSPGRVLYPSAGLYPGAGIYPGTGPAEAGVGKAVLTQGRVDATLAPAQVVVATLQILELVT